MKAGDDQLGARGRREYRDGILSHPSATTLGCTVRIVDEDDE